jgi:hypothetical protein
MDQLTNAARDAQALNRKDLAAELHLEEAIFDAQLGSGAGIGMHLAAANQVRGEMDVPMQLAATALAQATRGDVAAARQAAQKFAATSGSDEQWGPVVHAVNAAILLRENKPADARTELGQANPADPICRALLAESYAASGNLTDARTIKNQVVNNPQINLADMHQMIARVRASKIKA